MNRETIERRFAAAMQWAKGVAGRGFQKRVSDLSGVDTSNVSAIIGGKKGGSEEARRAMFRATVEQVPSLPPKGYDDFLSFGQWLLDGNAPEDWKPTAVVFKGRGHLHIKPTVKESLTVDQPNVSPGPRLHPAHRLPIISWVQAGDWAEVYDPFPPGYAEEWIDTAATNHPNAFALRVHGDSMEPEFVEGDIVVVDPGREPANGNFVICKNGLEATFKQLVIDGPSVFLKPLNPRYPIKDVTGVDVRIVGVVVEKRKQYA